MPQIAIATQTYDVYDTLANVNKYFGGYLVDNAWETAVDDTQMRAMVTATRLLDRLTWAGTKTSAVQPIAWPRTGVVIGGVAVDANTIPADILNGFAELAQLLISNPGLVSQVDTSDNTKSVKAGDVEASFFRPTQGTKLPVDVMRYISLYQGAVTLIGLASGSDAVSSFDDIDLFGLTDGYS